MANIPSFIQEAAPYVGTNGVTAAYLGYKTKGGVRTKELCVVFGVVEKKPLSALAAGAVLPQAIGALNTDVVQTGVYRAAPALPREHTDRVRPAPGGSSIGHYRITAGTLGCWVLKDGRPVILSNNHILANQNDAVIGDPILQPGPYDGGRDPADRLARLSQFVRVEANSDNEVDAALATPDDPTYVDYRIGNIIGRLNGPVNLVLDDAVRKDGRTTEFQMGWVTGIHAVVSVQYDRFVARFVNQLIITPGGFSAGGDSGSAVVDNQNRLGALLFAGGDNDTIASPIDRVIAALDIEIPNAGETPPPPPPVPTPDPGLNWQGWLVAAGLLLVAAVIAWLLR